MGNLFLHYKYFTFSVSLHGRLHFFTTRHIRSVQIVFTRDSFTGIKWFYVCQRWYVSHLILLLYVHSLFVGTMRSKQQSRAHKQKAQLLGYEILLLYWNVTINFWVRVDDVRLLVMCWLVNICVVTRCRVVLISVIFVRKQQRFCQFITKLNILHS